jgi:hypothetical protein
LTDRVHMDLISCQSLLMAHFCQHFQGT